MSENKIIISYKDKEINATIVELCETYSAITPKAIEYIAPIYYPIAYIELSMKEKTFEDFEPIQLAVLKLIILGFTECSVIANLLGLNSIYIEQIKKLLYGYQFIDDNSNITSLGRESVAAEKKIQLMDSRQVFQLDTINSRLIKLSDSIPDKSLKRKEQLSIKKAILNHPNYVDSDTIVNSLRDDEFRNIMSQRT